MTGGEVKQAGVGGGGGRLLITAVKKEEEGIPRLAEGVYLLATSASPASAPLPATHSES